MSCLDGFWAYKYLHFLEEMMPFYFYLADVSKKYLAYFHLISWQVNEIWNNSSCYVRMILLPNCSLELCVFIPNTCMTWIFIVPSTHGINCWTQMNILHFWWIHLFYHTESHPLLLLINSGFNKHLSWHNSTMQILNHTLTSWWYQTEQTNDHSKLHRFTQK